jgi:hypothetical protein
MKKPTLSEITDPVQRPNRFQPGRSTSPAGDADTQWLDCFREMGRTQAENSFLGLAFLPLPVEVATAALRQDLKFLTDNALRISDFVCDDGKSDRLIVAAMTEGFRVRIGELTLHPNVSLTAPQ